MGIRANVAKSTLADANEKRDWRIYAQLAQVLIRKARDLYRDEELDFQLQDTVYALDATTIDLCLNLFPWAHFRKFKGAVKLHTQIDLRGSIPTFLEITPGIVHDVNVLDRLIIEPGAYYVMDRGYIDFARLSLFREALAWELYTEVTKPLQKELTSNHLSVRVLHVKSTWKILSRGPFPQWRDEAVLEWI